MDNLLILMQFGIMKSPGGKGWGVGESTIVEIGIPICVLSFFCRFDILKA